MTTNDTITWAKATAILADSFELRTRDNGDKYYCRKDSAPDWVQNLVYDCHKIGGGMMLPNDWIYEKIAHYCDLLTNYESAEEATDAISSDIDPLVDIYSADLAAWLAVFQRSGIVESYVENCGNPDLTNGMDNFIMALQSQVLEHIATTVIAYAND